MKKAFFLFLIGSFALALVPTEVFATHTVVSISRAGGGNRVNPGETNVLVTITGTGFDCTGIGGCPSITFTPAGINVVGTPVLDDPTSIRATISVAPLATLGPRDVNVTTGPGAAHVVTLADGIAIVTGATGGGAGIGATPRERIPTNVTTAAQFIDMLDTLVDWIFVVVLIGAVIFIVLAGWQFISGGGEPQSVAQARNKLLWAGVGIIVAVLSRGIVAAVRNLIGS